jgi:ElaB/YqjD/DUF883 family membrane-anchored ribosome-binding protein
MYNKNEGFYTTGGRKNSKDLNEVVDKLEMLLKEIKMKAVEEGTEAKKDMSRILRDGMDKTTDALRRAKKQARVGMDRTTDTYKQVKEKYEKADPAQQKMIIVTLSAALASLVTAIGLAMCFTKKDR